MPRTGIRPPRRTAAAALLALVVLGVARPSDARAGCLFPHGTAPGHGVDHLDGLAQAGALSMPTDEASPATPPRPCAGLRCSNDPAPSAPIAPPASSGVEEWGCLAGVGDNPALNRSPLPRDDIAARPLRRGETLFHPPR